MSEKNINAILDRINAEMAAKPVERPRQDKCTGCGVKFSEEYDADDSCDDCGGRSLYSLYNL
jgi:rRNA maturation endonuclease Nob1